MLLSFYPFLYGSEHLKDLKGRTCPSRNAEDPHLVAATKEANNSMVQFAHRSLPLSSSREQSAAKALAQSFSALEELFTPSDSISTDSISERAQHRQLNRLAISHTFLYIAILHSYSFSFTNCIIFHLLFSFRCFFRESSRDNMFALSAVLFPSRETILGIPRKKLDTRTKKNLHLGLPPYTDFTQRLIKYQNALLNCVIAIKTLLCITQLNDGN